VFCFVKIDGDLAVEPELWRGAESLAKSKRGGRRDAAAAVDDLVDCHARHSKLVGECTLGETERLDELLEKHLAGRSWHSVGRDHPHRASSSQ
jgi:hypothetical protein